MKVGMGYDIHRLVPARPLVLGGVDIPHPYGLQGHSDADVLLHAVIDALMGASALGDIGQHFPDTNPRYKGISSLALLEHTAKLLKKKRVRIVNIDAIIVAEAPKMAPHIPTMRQRIAKALKVPAAQVSVKAKTNEGLGPVGQREAIAAYAVASVR